MKKRYVKPEVEIEYFHLCENVAACATRVLFGPDDGSGVCGDFGFPEDPFKAPRKMDAAAIKPFYEASCVCYYTAPKDSGYFSS